MEQNEALCSICLEPGPKLRIIGEYTDDNLQLITKLESCVKELIWKEDHMICSVCDAELQLFYQFRLKCIKSDIVRSQNSSLEKKPPELVTSEDPPVLKLEEADSCRFTSPPEAVSRPVETPELQRDDELVPEKPFQRIMLRRHVCLFCGKGFSYAHHLKRHEKTHKRQFKCELCVNSYNTDKALVLHKFVVHADPKFWSHVCKVCEERFPIKRRLDAHVVRKHHGVLRVCQFCDKAFASEAALRRHLPMHARDRISMCDICNEQCKNEKEVALHKTEVHGIRESMQRVKKGKLNHSCACCDCYHEPKGRKYRRVQASKVHAVEKADFEKVPAVDILHQ